MKHKNKLVFNLKAFLSNILRYFIKLIAYAFFLQKFKLYLLLNTRTASNIRQKEN